MATLDHARRVIVLDESDDQAVEQLVAAGVKAGLISQGRGRSASVSAGEATAAPGRRERPVRVSPRAQSRRG